MSELSTTQLRSDLAIMAKYGRLIGRDVTAPTATGDTTTSWTGPCPRCGGCEPDGCGELYCPRRRP